MTRIHWIKTGLAILIAGIIYDAVFVGIPYQDPTEEMLEKYNSNNSIANALMLAGFTLIIIGIIIRLFRKKEK